MHNVEKNRPKTITFKNGSDKDRIDQLLAGVKMRNCMPDSIRGKRAPMTLWAIEYLTKLLEGGACNLQDNPFTNSTPEWEVMTLENEYLQNEVRLLRRRIEELEKLEEGYINTINMLTKK